MEKRIQKDSWLRKIWTLAVVGVMAIGGAGSAWGTDYTINTQNSKTFPQANVPTMTDTVYIKDGETRVLAMTEMQLLTSDGLGLSMSYDWYIRWYRMNQSNEVIAINNIFKDNDNVLKETSDNKSLFWFHYFIKSGTPSNRSQAATINYTKKGEDEDIVICDVSTNLDGLGYHSNSSATADFSEIITEPTIGRRCRYIIRNSSEIAAKVDATTDAKPLYTYDMTLPKGATNVNLQMEMTPENYYWHVGSTLYQGTYFSYEKVGGETIKGVNNTKVCAIGTVSDDLVINVFAVTSDGAQKKLIARFNLQVQEGANFMLDDNVATSSDESRNPQDHREKYGLIGVQDFDFGEADQITNLSAENNMRTTSLDYTMTTYAFNDPTVLTIHPYLSCLENTYGLYRSANAPSVSENDIEYQVSWKGYNDFSLAKDSSKNSLDVRPQITRWYHWYFAADASATDVVAYDITHGEDPSKYGYFYYLNAAQLPGRIVNIPLSGTLCGGTELTITAWLNNMTGKTALQPQVNLILRGRKGQQEDIIHRFTTGDLGENTLLGRWYQVKFTFVLPTEVSEYESFSVEVLNNTLNSSGADYAIDDIRIYKTLPDIEVYRKNECEASTLIVSTSYDAILTNMGWIRGETVATDAEFDFDDPENLEYRKYRYGLMGDKHQYVNSTVGNVYFAFWDDDNEEWQTVNEAVAEYSQKAAMSLRVAVSTVQSRNTEGGTNGWEFYTNDETDALKFEQTMNLRAVDDYNADITEWQKKEGTTKHPKEIDVSKVGTPGTDGFDEEEYQKAIIELFGNRLDIPRLRCPWYDEDPTDPNLYLGIIDVNNTSLKYRGQIDANGKAATGEYQVVTFSAEAVADAASTGGEYEIDPKSACTLMSPFVVEPATTVLIDAVSPGDPEIAVCVGTVHQIQAYLNFYDKDTNTPIPEETTKDYEYIFDWYLGPMTAYDEITAENGFSIKTALNAYREDMNNTSALIFPEDIDKWIAQDTNNEAMGGLLKDLLNEGLLLLGTPANEPFDMPIDAERMVAMPYLPSEMVANIEYEFCSAETEVNLQAVADPIPEMHHGFVNVSYPAGTEVALRLGWPNMNSTTLDLPIYKVENMVLSAKYLGLDGNQPAEILLDDEILGLPPVGTVTSLHIEKPEGDGKLTSTAKMTFSLSTDAKKYLKEGQDYILLIPFVQFDENNKQLGSACNGLLHLPVKIVPEYLTWQGESTDKWYADDNWNQSTKKELYSGTTDTDYNGSDVIADAYSPLYFTNITILGNTDKAKSELQLENKGEVDENGMSLSLEDTYLTSTGEDEYPIKYDLAVNTDDKDNWIITPYYINKVNQIYFKPEATLLNQHRLTYDKAWVEFEMKPGDDYWMASPLKEVYAGDMYAPTDGGQQNTEAFTDITYGSGNSRWNPAFYQKAWDNDIKYAASDTDKDGVPDESEIASVKVVPSNWSIEYNDVTVPYTIGKGFYSRVEMTGATDNTVRVRLPKAVNDYKYEYSPTTRALHDVTDKTNQKNLADLDADDGSMTLDLLTKVDNDGDHFLVGNPYMAYLDMSEFLKANNSVLAEKYWTIDNGKVIVGTPDVVGTTGEWPNAQTAGYVAPMQAFFVESKDYDPSITKADGETMEAKKVTFKASMTVDAATATAKGKDTKSFSAVNPILTLTATSKQGQSRAAVVQKSDASNQYEADKDAVALLDSEIDAPMAYTVAGSYAAAVNAIHDYKNVPLGVYAKDGEEVELSIEGASQLVSPLYLYDAVTRSTTPIDGDSFTLNLTGSSHGRYFLTTDEGIKAEGDIRIYSPADGQLIIASTPSDRLKQVQVYDLNGRMVESRQNVGTATCQLYVPGGIYIVRVQSEQGEAQAKLKIK